MTTARDALVRLRGQVEVLDGLTRSHVVHTGDVLRAIDAAIEAEKAAPEKRRCPTCESIVAVLTCHDPFHLGTHDEAKSTAPQTFVDWARTQGHQSNEIAWDWMMKGWVAAMEACKAQAAPEGHAEIVRLLNSASYEVSQSNDGGNMRLESASDSIDAAIGLIRRLSQPPEVTERPNPYGGISQAQLRSIVRTAAGFTTTFAPKMPVGDVVEALTDDKADELIEAALSPKEPS